MIKEESKISFTQDILKEVSNDLNIPEEKVKIVYNSMISYLEFLTTKTDTVSIFIPSLGTMYVKLGYILRRIQELSRKKGDKNYLEIFKAKKNKIDAYLKELIDNKYPKKSRHSQKSTIALFSYTDGKSIDEIEEIQNSK
ncbi:MAG: hypothetical protein KC414_12780 [Romboutsia sp.]|nr:hypothetical protein [Romboutsia sp.]